MRKQTGETLLVKKSGSKFYIPDEGDVIWINLDPQAGCEQKGHRPAVVISPMSYNQQGLAIVCAITSKVKGYPFEVPLPKNLDTVGVILVNHIKSLDWKERGAELIEKINQETLYEIKNILNCIILPSVKNN
jgi:mRNA interferase MazF